MATSIEARYKATTPMFCGGADGMGAELRLPSFKGSLRFWWRGPRVGAAERRLGEYQEGRRRAFRQRRRRPVPRFDEAGDGY